MADAERAPAAGGQQPVAWLCRNGTPNPWCEFTAEDAKKARRFGFSVTPLYAAPQVPQPSGTEGERVARLVEEAAKALEDCRECVLDAGGSLSRDPCDIAADLRAALAAAPPAQPATMEVGPQDQRADWSISRRITRAKPPAPVGEQDSEYEAWLEEVAQRNEKAARSTQERLDADLFATHAARYRRILAWLHAQAKLLAALPELEEQWNTGNPKAASDLFHLVAALRGAQ